MFTLRLVCVTSCALLALETSARGDAFRTPPFSRGPHVSVQAYGSQNPACVSWTNGCVLCTADPGGRTQCSTPGIACEPRGLRCQTLRRP